MVPSFSYSLFGLNIRSQIPLDLVESDQTIPDVEIRRGRVGPSDQNQPGYVVTEEGTLLNIPRVGRYLIRDGREIIVEAEGQVSERNLRLFLLGSAFGALLHQRGLMPLHANAIEIDGCAFAFSGHSGAGKSTIAAWFHDRGHRVLADDVCVIGFDPSGRPLAFPGIPRLRLWREALEAGGRTAAGYERSFDDMDKYDVPTGTRGSGQPVELDIIYMLGKAEPGAGKARIRPLKGVEAVGALVSNTYRGGYLAMMNGTKRHLLQCVDIANKVPIFSAERLWGYEAFAEQARMLEEHARAILARKPSRATPASQAFD